MIGLPSVFAGIADRIGPFAPVWYQWAAAITKAANLDYGSGTTADRPTGTLPTSARYFDVTLGLPIWWNGAIWIKADGTAA